MVHLKYYMYEFSDQEDIQLGNSGELPVAAPHLSLPILQSLLSRKLGNSQGYFLT